MCDKAIFFDISHHGFGHLAQTAPVIDRLRDRFPSVRAVVRTRYPRDLVRAFVAADIDVYAPPPEATMVAPSATTIDLDASAGVYSRLHADWESLVKRESQTIRNLQPAAVVANVNPLSLAAAQRASVPTIGLCCMNWLDVYRRYFGRRPEAAEIIGAMTDAYAGSYIFLQPRPHMAMEDLPQRRSIGPVARQGRDCRGELRRTLGLATDERVVLLTLGGLPNPLTLDLPRIEGVHWLARRAIGPVRDDVSAIEATEISLIDLIFSADAVVCKDSYCTVVEAASAGVGLVMAPRDGWPETDCLVKWAEQHCNFALAPGGFDEPGELIAALCKVLGRDPLPPVEANGVDEAVDAIAAVCQL